MGWTKHWFDFRLQHSWLTLKRPVTKKSFIKNLVIMTRHYLLMLGETGFVWISGNVALAGQQEWGAAWAAVFGRCFVWAAAGGLHPWVFVACELEPFGTSAGSHETWMIRFLCLDLVASWCRGGLCLWPAHHGTRHYRVHKINTTEFSSCHVLLHNKSIFKVIIIIIRLWVDEQIYDNMIACVALKLKK